MNGFLVNFPILAIMTLFVGAFVTSLVGRRNAVARNIVVAVSVTAALGMILAIDPLVDEREDLPDASEAYFQMLGRHGLLDSYSDDDLERILDMTARFDDVTIVFRTCDSLGDARRLLKLSKTYVPNADFEFDDEFDDEDELDDEDDDMDDDIE